MQNWETGTTTLRTKAERAVGFALGRLAKT